MDDKDAGPHGALFLGEYTLRLDARRGIRLPGAFCERLQSGSGGVRQLYLLCADALRAYPVTGFERLVSGMCDDPGMKSARCILEAAHNVTWSKTGRLVLPEAVCAFVGAHPGGEVVLAGMGDWFELWSAAAWAHK